MLPYTTYNIPERTDLTAPDTERWLWLITEKNLSDDDHDLLKKISGALKADFNRDVHLLETEKEQMISLTDYDSALPKLIISFGVAPASLGLWIDLPQPGMVTLEKFTFIRTKSLEALANNTSAKKELWGAMKAFLEHQSTT